LAERAELQRLYEALTVIDDDTDIDEAVERALVSSASHGVEKTTQNDGLMTDEEDEVVEYDDADIMRAIAPSRTTVSVIRAR